MAWTVVAKEGDLAPGEMTSVKVGRLELLLANVDGTYHATDATCTHRGGPLPDGSLAGAIVTCPWHGSRFDLRTGAVQSPPAAMPIRVYAVRVENGAVLVEAP